MYKLNDGTTEHEFNLSAPASKAQRLSITSCASSNQIYAVFAALGACWRGAARPKVKISSVNHDFLKYGQAVCDELADRGFDIAEMMEVAAEAFTLCMVGIISAEDVKQNEDFIEAQGEDSIG